MRAATLRVVHTRVSQRTPPQEKNKGRNSAGWRQEVTHALPLRVKKKRFFLFFLLTRKGKKNLSLSELFLSCSSQTIQSRLHIPSHARMHALSCVCVCVEKDDKKWRSHRHAADYSTAQFAFEDSMSHWALQFTPLFAPRRVLHRVTSLEIHRCQLFLTFS